MMFSQLKKWVIWLVGGPERAARSLGVTIGRGCRIICSPDCFGSEPWLVTVAAGVRFLTHDGSGWLVRDGKGRRFRYRPIRVGSQVFIGTCSILLPGVQLGNRVIVGAGSVVTKSVPDGTIVAGNPARSVGVFEEFEKQALTEWVTGESRQTRGFREWVDSVLDRSSRPTVDTGSTKRN